VAIYSARSRPFETRRDTYGQFCVSLTAKQFLAYCRKKKCAQVWIITRDPDFLEKYNEKLLLNPTLHLELKRAGISDVHCFEKVLTGIRDFSRTVGLSATKLPNEHEAKKIEEKIDALPPLSFIDDQWMAAVRNAQIRQAYIAATSGASSGVLPSLPSLPFPSPPESK
jgi:hypothetical protein